MALLDFPHCAMKVALNLAAHEHANILPHEVVNIVRKKSPAIFAQISLFKKS
jgi:hypothetical protein